MSGYIGNVAFHVKARTGEGEFSVPVDPRPFEGRSKPAAGPLARLERREASAAPRQLISAGTSLKRRTAARLKAAVPVGWLGATRLN